MISSYFGSSSYLGQRYARSCFHNPCIGPQTGGAPMKRGPPRSAGVRRKPFSLKSRFFDCFWPQEWFGWVRTGRRIHLVFVSGQTVDSGPISGQIGFFEWDRNFGQPGLDLGFLLLRQVRCLSSSHLSCLNSRHLSCLNRRHLSCLNRRRDSCRPPAGCCYVFY